MNSRFSDLSAPRPRLIAVMTVLLLVLPAFAQVNVLTQHNDNARTGTNLNETILTPSNVNVNQFGMLFKRVVDDQVYGQPLVVTNVNIAGGTHNVVYVTTVHNSVYAFDADNVSATAPYWHVNLGTPVPAAGHFGCTDMTGNMSIVGTPVIDANTNTLYVVSLTPSGTSFVQHLHALDISTGAEKFGGPVQITASEFNALNQNQRPALLLANGNVYIGYSSHCDQNTYHGFLIGYSASTLQQIGVFNSSPNTSGKGDSIWHSGTGPAVDANGNIYVITGNGTWDGVSRFSETFVKLSPSLHMIDWFTPHDHATLDSADADVNSGGPMLLPGTNLLIGGGKGAKLYVIDTNNFGHLGNSTDSNIVQSFQTGTFGKQHLHNLAFWNSAVNGPMLYTWPQADRFKVYKFNGSTFNTTPFMIQPTANTGHPGGMLSISANGNTNGIVWAAIMASGDAWHSSQPGILHAFDANNINNELWNSLQNSSRDNCNNYSKMAPPTIANGKVYLPSFGTTNAGTGQFCVYGLFNNAEFTLTASPASQTVSPGSGTSYTATLSPLRGFNSDITLGVSGLPAGATGSFAPNPVTGGSGSSTLTVSTSSTTPGGTYTLTLTGTGGGITHSIHVTLNVNSPNFALSASPASQTVTVGGSTSYTATVSAMNGFTGTVALTVSGQPAGVTASLNPTSVSGSGTSTLSVSTTSSASTGTFTLTITGASGSLSRTTSVTLVVNPVVSTCPKAVGGGGWVNTAVASQTGTFTATFDATPAHSNMNSVVALSHGAGTAYTAFANLVAFNGTQGIILARNGGTYPPPVTTVPYTGGLTYHFRLAVNVPAHTYSIFVTPPGGSEVTIGNNYAFRLEQNTVTSLNNYGVFVGTTSATDTLTVCNFGIQ